MSSKSAFTFILILEIVEIIYAIALLGNGQEAGGPIALAICTLVPLFVSWRRYKQRSQRQQQHRLDEQVEQYRRARQEFLRAQQEREREENIDRARQTREREEDINGQRARQREREWQREQQQQGRWHERGDSHQRESGGQPKADPAGAMTDIDRAYEMLYVKKGAPLEIAEAAYRTAMKKAHPDAGGTETRALELTLAIKTIRDNT